MMIGNFRKTFKPTEQDKLDKVNSYNEMINKSIENKDCITCKNRTSLPYFEHGKESSIGYCRVYLEYGCYHTNCMFYEMENSL